MTGYHDSKSSLEGILDSVSAADTSYKHRIMQLSASAYILETTGFKKGYGEYYFIFDAGNSKKKNAPYKMRWPADIVLVYNENGRNIVEIIEVETRVIERYGNRTQNLKYKERKVDRAYSLRRLNWIIRDADEVRFSVVMDASRLSDENLYAQVKELVSRFDRGGGGLSITEHNIYLLRKSVMDFAPNRKHAEKEYIKSDLSQSLEKMYSYGIGSLYTTISWQKARSLG